MTIQFTCPTCRETLQAADDRAGAKLACPACRESVAVPKPDLHDRVRTTAGHAEKTAVTVSKVAKATGKAADAISDLAEAGDKVQKAVTSVAGISAGGSTILGGAGDFLRPLGNINLVVFVAALGCAGVLFAAGKRKGVKVKVRVKLGTVAALAVALVFGLWTGAGAIAGGDRGVLATKIPAVERAQAAVLPVKGPEPQPVVVQTPPSVRPAVEDRPPAGQPPATPAGEPRPAGWVALLDDLPQVVTYWRQGNSAGCFLFEPASKTLRIDNYHNLATVYYNAPWKEFAVEIDASRLVRKVFALRLGSARLDIANHVVEHAGFVPVAVKLSDAGDEVIALVAGKEAARARLGAGDASRRNRFSCGFHCGLGPEERHWRNIVQLRNARLLALGQEHEPPLPLRAAGKEKGWIEMIERQDQVLRYWKGGERVVKKGGESTRLELSSYDAATRTIKCDGYHGLGRFEYEGPWREFQIEVELPAWKPRQLLAFIVNGNTLSLGAVLSARKGPVPVAIRFDPDTCTLAALVEGKVVQRATLTEGHGVTVTVNQGGKTRVVRGGGRRSLKFSCQVHSGLGEASRKWHSTVYLRKARLLALEPQ